MTRVLAMVIAIRQATMADASAITRLIEDSVRGISSADYSMDSAENRDAMSFRQLTNWAWRETPPVHMSRGNLLIHLIAVPMFVAGHVILICGAILSWWLVALALASIVASLILQGVGHSLEQQQVPVFTGTRDFVRRLYAEQFCNFWRFVASKQWYAHFRAAGLGG